jgi:hypothetical protein
MADTTLRTETAGPPIGAPATAVPRTIVPLGGIPIVLLVLAALVAAIASNKLWALDFFHVVGGALWTGVDLFVGLVIGPILRRMSVQARVEFSSRFMPKMLLIMPTLVIVTLTAGFQLARLLGNLNSATPLHGWIVASFVVVGVLTVIAIGVLEPANLAVLFELRKPHPNGELIGRLMRRFVYAAGVIGAAQLATLVIMTKLASG